MKTSLKTLTLVGALGLLLPATASVAQATPLLEWVGGSTRTQHFVPDPFPWSYNIIPNGALGFDAEFGTPGGLVLRDTTAASGTPLTVWFSYIGTDSYFSNQFIAGNGGLQWCTDRSGNCDPGYTVVTGPNSFTGPVVFTGSITALVDSLIPFSFIANASPGPRLVLSNGMDGWLNSAHLSAFDITNGFEFNTFNSTGTRFAVGLTDGHYGDCGDDDHQDFLVTVSTEPVPEPASLLLMGTGMVLLAVRLRRHRQGCR